MAQGDYAGNHNGRRNDSKTSQPVKFGSKKITNGPAGIRAVFCCCFFSPKDFFVHLFKPHWSSKRRHLYLFVLPSSFVVYFLASEEEFVLSKALVYNCFLVFRRIGEYIHWHWAKHVWLYSDQEKTLISASAVPHCRYPRPKTPRGRTMVYSVPGKT